jgi:hypothetical protein
MYILIGGGAFVLVEVVVVVGVVRSFEIVGSLFRRQTGGC